MLRYTTDRARPGLVALYDIRPGNGAGQFLQPRSPHGADLLRNPLIWLPINYANCNQKLFWFTLFCNVSLKMKNENVEFTAGYS